MTRACLSHAGRHALPSKSISEPPTPAVRLEGPQSQGPKGPALQEPAGSGERPQGQGLQCPAPSCKQGTHGTVTACRDLHPHTVPQPSSPALQQDEVWGHVHPHGAAAAGLQVTPRAPLFICGSSQAASKDTARLG